MLFLGTYNYGSGFEATDVSVVDGSLFVNVQGNAGVWQDPPISTPEPGSILLLRVGLAVLSLRRRRKTIGTTNTVSGEPLG